jgi:ornithine--oxo-acid transaminase
MLNDLFGPQGLWSDHFPFGEYHVAGRNSGSEGVELALRLAAEVRFDYRQQCRTHRHADKDTIVAFEGAWHGWTAGLIPLLNRKHYRVGLGESTTATYGLRVKHLPFGHPELLEQFFRDHGKNVLAVLVEPIQGDAGILLPPGGFLRRLRELSDLYDALLVADEVLTFAKTGRYFAMADANGPVPTDITIIGKSLGMGCLSTSMVIARRCLQVRPSGAVCTSDLRPPVCELIRLGTELLEREGLVRRTAERGDYLRRLLKTRLLDRFPSVFSEVRGQGFLNGIELTEVAARAARNLRIHLLEAGAYVELMAGAGRRGGGLRFQFPTLRIAPPLVISDDELDELVNRLEWGTRTFVESVAC